MKAAFGQTRVGATHDEELATWPSSSAEARAMGIQLGIFKADPNPATVTFTASLEEAIRQAVGLGIAVYNPRTVETLTSAPELEVWRHRDGGAT